MGVGNVEAYDRYTYFTAWDCLFDCFRYPFCKEHQGGVFLVGEVEDVVDLFFGNYQNMAGVHRVYVEESEVALIFGHFV